MDCTVGNGVTGSLHIDLGTLCVVQGLENVFNIPFADSNCCVYVRSTRCHQCVEHDPLASVPILKNALIHPRYACQALPSK